MWNVDIVGYCHKLSIFCYLDALHLSGQLPRPEGPDRCQVQRGRGHRRQGLRVRGDKQVARVPQEVSPGQGSRLRGLRRPPADRVQRHRVLRGQR